MSIKACVVILGSVVLSVLNAPSAMALDRVGEQAPPGAGASSVWTVLQTFEEAALLDYEFHRTTSDVRERGELLATIARDPRFQGNCGAAARTLSYMVTGFYESSQRLEIAADWHYFSPQYMTRRGACLIDLGLDASAFPLPRWFGR